MIDKYIYLREDIDPDDIIVDELEFLNGLNMYKMEVVRLSLRWLVAVPYEDKPIFSCIFDPIYLP